MSEDNNLVRLDFSCTDGDARNLIIKYPVAGTRWFHLVTMKARAVGSVSFREYEDSEHCQCIEILGLPIEEIESDEENNTRTIRLKKIFEACVLLQTIRLGRLSPPCVEDIPLKMSRDDWATALEVPVQEAQGSIVSTVPLPHYHSQFHRC